jgi:molybdate transport system substrate-binding protein
MRYTVFFAIALVLGFTALVSAAELRFFAGAGLRQPVDRLAANFEEKTGHRVFVDYAGSGRLLARISASGRGDLYMPGSFFYIEKLLAQGRIHSWRPVVVHTPVMAINKSEAQRLIKFEDLAKPGVRLALGDPKAMALGRAAMTILERSGLKEKILANVVTHGATVKQLILYVAEGSVDAAIVGRADAFQFRDRVAMIPIPENICKPETVAAAVLTTTNDLKAAAALQDFLASPEAIQVFEGFGFLPLR